MDRRKVLKQAYKETPRSMGVLQITNEKNGKRLILGSMNLPGSINSQRFQLNIGSHRNKELQADWQLFGSKAFSFEVLENLKPAEFAPEEWRAAVDDMEEKWKAQLQPFGEKGYN